MRFVEVSGDHGSVIVQTILEQIASSTDSMDTLMPILKHIDACIISSIVFVLRLPSCPTGNVLLRLGYSHEAPVKRRNRSAEKQVHVRKSKNLLFASFELQSNTELCTQVGPACSIAVPDRTVRQDYCEIVQPGVLRIAEHKHKVRRAPLRSKGSKRPFFKTLFSSLKMVKISCTNLLEDFIEIYSHVRTWLVSSAFPGLIAFVCSPKDGKTDHFLQPALQVRPRVLEALVRWTQTVRPTGLPFDLRKSPCQHLRLEAGHVCIFTIETLPKVRNIPCPLSLLSDQYRSPATRSATFSPENMSSTVSSWPAVNSAVAANENLRS